MIGPSMPGGGGGDGAEAPRRKKSKQERQAEARALERDLRPTSGAGVDYSKVSDRHVDDVRY